MSESTSGNNNASQNQQQHKPAAAPEFDAQQADAINKLNANYNSDSLVAGSHDSNERSDFGKAVNADDKIVEKIPKSVRLDAGDYEIGEKLGGGGFGCVYRAVQKVINRSVAVKKFHKTGTDEQFEAAVAEAVRSMKLDHPNIVYCIGIITTKVMGLEEVFQVMELGEKSLLSLLKECNYQLPFDKCIDYAQQIAAGLDYLHSSQPRILHLDLKPCNALVFTEGRVVKLCDFGLSIDVEGSHDSVSSSAIGTYRWMAPEILLDKKQLRPQCDVYSFGAILYCFVCGKEPWADVDPKSDAMKEKVKSGTLVDTITPIEGCPQHLTDVCRRCLQKDPMQRPKDGAELVQLLSGGAAIVPSAPAAAAAPAVSSAAVAKPSLVDDWMSVLQLDGKLKQALRDQDIDSVGMFLALSDDEVKDIFSTVGQRKTVKAEMQRLANAIEAQKVQKAKDDAIRRKGLTIVEIDIVKSFQDLLAALGPFAEKKSCVHLRFTNPSKAQKVTCFAGDWYYDEWKPFERVIASADSSALTDVTEIGDYFLYCCYELKEVDLSGFRNVTTIESGFLGNCSGLTQLDLSQLSNVTTIGGSFLCECRGLAQLDLTPLSKVTSIGEGFLFGCSGLTQLDLSPLSNVTSIGRNFLYDCTGLTQLDLSPLSNVTTVENYFLSRCSGLTQLDLSPLSNVTSIGGWFLRDCRGLTQLDMSGMEKVKSVGSYCFLYDCSNLLSVKLSAALMQSSSVPEWVKKLAKK